MLDQIKINNYKFMKKVIVLEDEKVLREVYKKTLSSAGYEVVGVETAEDAEEIIKKFHPDLFLIDHGLAGEKEGIEALPNFKKQFPNSIFIVFSNYNDFHLQNIALESGADAYWIKINMSLKDLLENVSNLLSGKRECLMR